MYVCMYVICIMCRMNVYVYIYIYMCVCVCVCVCVCTYTRAGANCFIFEWSERNHTSLENFYVLFMRQKALLGPRPPQC